MRLLKYIEALSPITFISSILSAIIGASITYSIFRHVDLIKLSIVIICLILIHSGVNLYNDYRDYTTGIDIEYRKVRTLHRVNMILDLNVDPKLVRNISIILIGIAIVLGSILLISLSIIEVFIIVFLGVFIGVGYSSPIVKLRYRGFGEIFAGIATGPLITCGTFIVLSNTLNIYGITLSIIAGLANGMYTTIILTKLAIARYDVDLKLGKKTIAVVLGLENVKYVLYIFIFIIYLVPIVLIILKSVSLIILLTYITLPLTLHSLKVRNPFYIFAIRCITSTFICLGFILH